MVTIIDVAKRAGVSNTTVSRAFNPNSVIKDSTRKKILKIANEIGYAPNLSARGLVTNKKFVLGVFFSSIHTHMSTYLSTIISDVYDSLPQDYILSVEGIDRITNFSFQVANRFDGILVVSQTHADDKFINSLSRSKVPAVVILRPVETANIDNIFNNDEAGIRKAVEFAVRNGHKKFGFINGRKDFLASTRRHHSLIQSCYDYHVKLVKDADIDGDFTISAGQNAIDTIIDLPQEKRPTCVLCASDDIALGAIQRCQQRKVSVPNELSIIGFDNISYSTIITPALTTINNPFEEMASSGIKMLIERVNGQRKQKSVKITEPEIVVRDSVTDLNQN